MPKIFISYRREDSLDITCRICESLDAHFGRGTVFLDMDTIPPGANVSAYLEASLSKCKLLLAVIGTRWLDVGYNDAKCGQRRLGDPADFVRIEIQSADLWGRLREVITNDPMCPKYKNIGPEGEVAPNTGPQADG